MEYWYVLRKGFGKARERPGDDPEPCLVPTGQEAGDDIHHHALRDDGIGFGENGAAAQQLGLWRQAAMRRGHGLIGDASRAGSAD